MLKTLLDSLFGQILKAITDYFSGPKVDSVIMTETKIEKLDPRSDISKAKDLINKFGK